MPGPGAAAATGPGSGAFTSNVMYMRDTVTSLPGSGRSAVIRGTAAITGLGAGYDRPFTVKATAGRRGRRPCRPSAG